MMQYEVNLAIAMFCKLPGDLGVPEPAQTHIRTT